MSRIYDIAHKYVDDYAALDPMAATRMGIPGYDHLLSDLSVAGTEAIADHNRKTLAELQSAPLEGDSDRIARDVMQERIGVTLALHDTGEPYLSLRTLGSPMASVRSVFDQMPRTDAAAWANIAARMNAVPQALDQY